VKTAQHEAASVHKTRLAPGTSRAKALKLGEQAYTSLPPASLMWREKNCIIQEAAL